MSLINRRMLFSGNNKTIFEYVNTISVHCKYGSVAFNLLVENNTCYILFPTNNEEPNKFLFVNCHNDKFAFCYCNESTTNGFVAESNYSINDGIASFMPKLGNNTIYDIEFEIYKCVYS